MHICTDIYGAYTVALACIEHARLLVPTCTLLYLSLVVVLQTHRSLYRTPSTIQYKSVQVIVHAQYIASKRRRLHMRAGHDIGTSCARLSSGAKDSATRRLCACVRTSFRTPRTVLRARLKHQRPAAARVRLGCASVEAMGMGPKSCAMTNERSGFRKRKPKGECLMTKANQNAAGERRVMMRQWQCATNSQQS